MPTARNTAPRLRPTTNYSVDKDPHFTVGSVPSVRTAAATTIAHHHHMNLPIAEVYGNLTSAFGLLGAALGVGLIGFKAAEAVGRNPGASGKVLVQAIIGMALAEGLGILALFLATK